MVCIMQSICKNNKGGEQYFICHITAISDREKPICLTAYMGHGLYQTPRCMKMLEKHQANIAMYQKRIQKQIAEKDSEKSFKPGKRIRAYKNVYRQDIL